MQADDGGAVYLRLSTRVIDQPKRDFSDRICRRMWIAGAYWLREPIAGRRTARIVYSGGDRTEAMRPPMRRSSRTSRAELAPRNTSAGPASNTDWQAATVPRPCPSPPSAPSQYFETLALSRLPPDAGLSHGHGNDNSDDTYGWLGWRWPTMTSRRLGVEKFRAIGPICRNLYRIHGIDADAILDAQAQSSPNACAVGGRSPPRLPEIKQPALVPQVIDPGWTPVSPTKTEDEMARIKSAA